MAKNILKEAIADAKAVREVALANAKAALEEAFTPKLKSMLSAKLSEELDEEMYDEDDVDEGHGMHYDEDSMDEEIDLEEILNELELDEDDSEEMDEEIENIQENACTSCNEANEEFDLDLLLQEINNLEEKEDGDKKDMDEEKDEVSEEKIKKFSTKDDAPKPKEKDKEKEETNEALVQELNEVKKAYAEIKSELNEVNLLNSKLLYVNRIFKANHLDDSQKLRVVETLDKAESVKEAKLIYETIKDTFNVANAKKASFKRNKTKTLKEGLGMASKAAGISTAPKKEIISESTNMVNRFQKLANIKIK